MSDDTIVRAIELIELVAKPLISRPCFCKPDIEYTCIPCRAKPLLADLRRHREAYADLLAACEEAFGVLTEPGMMDVDYWKAWQRRTIGELAAAIAKARGGK